MIGFLFLVGAVAGLCIMFGLTGLTVLSIIQVFIYLIKKVW